MFCAFCEVNRPSHVMKGLITSTQPNKFIFIGSSAGIVFADRHEKKTYNSFVVSQIIHTFATHLVCRSKDVYVPRPAIKRESGVNPGLSRSCKSLIHANMMSLRFSGRRSYWATSQKTCLLHIIQRPWDWTTIEHETKVYYKLHATGYGACIAPFFRNAAAQDAGKRRNTPLARQQALHVPCYGSLKFESQNYQSNLIQKHSTR